MFKDAFNTSQSLDHISTIVVEVPELSVMLLMSPPEGILLQNLVLFEVLSHSPALVVGQGKSVLLEESVNSRNTSVPGIFKVGESKAPVLGHCFFSLEGVLCPDTLRVYEFTLPRLNIPVKVRDELIFLMRHTCTEMADTSVSLLAEP